MKRNKKVIRIIAIVLAVLLAGGVIVGALMSAFAVAEESPEPNRYSLSMEYLEEEQALRIEQRLVYYNRTPDPLDRVLFYAAPNMFRRESALMYENDDLEKVFFAGFAPGGIDLQSVWVDGQPADFGFQGEDELYLRVACDLRPGDSAEFDFHYYLLLTACGAFTGVGETDVRLQDFYFIPGVYDASEREFALKKPLAFTRWIHTDPADFEVALQLPEGYDVASTGMSAEGASDPAKGLWTLQARDVRAFALCFGRRYRVTARRAASGVAVRVFTGRRDAGRVADMAFRAVERCEEWFGPFPARELDIAESDYPLGALNAPGLILLSSDLLGGAQLELKLFFCVAQQVFGLAAYAEPSADAWLSDSLSQYLAYLMLEADKGHDAFLAAINRDWVADLQHTVPGGLTVNSDASLMSAREYATVILTRGAVVFHELREAMGLESLLRGLSNFYQMGLDGHTLTEMDLVHALDEASGGDWRDFLTDWVFNVGDYVGQSIDWLN